MLAPSALRRWLIALVGSLVVVGLAPATVAQAVSTTLGPFTAAGDAYATDAAPTVTKGTTDNQSCFTNDSSPGQRCYLAFTVSGLQAGDTITSAKVLLSNKGGAGTKMVEMFATSSFSESTLTWNNKPALGAQQGSDSTHTFQTDSEFSVNSGVIPNGTAGNGTYYFAVAPTNVAGGLNWYTKENTAGQSAPRLSVVINRPAAPVISAFSASPQTGDAPLSTVFSVTATDPDNDIVSCTFDPWDGTTPVTQSCASPFNHTYTAVGTYQAAVDVVDATGLHDVEFYQVNVTQANRAPVAALSLPPTTATRSAVTADASGSTDADSNPLTYSFNWGDGSSNTGPQSSATASHTYPIPGNYTVTVTVSDGTLSDTEIDVVQSRPEFGSNANGTFRSSYDPIKVQRVFSGSTLPVWGTGDLSAAITTVVSTKPSISAVNSGSLDSTWATWAGTIPTNRKVHIAIWHEPEDDVYVSGTFTAAQFRSANIRLHDIVMLNKPAGADVEWDVILMSATLNTAGRNWHDFWPDNDANDANGSPYVNVLSWDNYWGTADDGSTEPTRVVGGVTVFNDVFYRFGTGGQRDVFAVNASVNTAIAFAEWGYDHDATRVKYLDQMEKFAIYGPGPGPVGTQPSTSAHPPVPVDYLTYFDIVGTTGDHELDRSDGADRTDWAAIVAA